MGVVNLCPWCDELVEDGEDYETTNDGELRYHRACLIRQVVGSVAHQRRECSCYGGTGEDSPNLTPREAARAAWNYFLEHHVQETDLPRRN